LESVFCKDRFLFKIELTGFNRIARARVEEMTELFVNK